MKNFIKIGLLTALFVTSNPALSECAGFNCSNVLVTRIVVRPYNANVQIRTSGDESKLTCDAGSGNYLNIGSDQVNYDSTYSLLLTAHTTQSPISIRTNGDGSSCVIQYIVSDK